MLTIDQNENAIVLILILNSRLSAHTKEMLSLTYSSSDKGINLDINIKSSGKKLTVFCSHDQIQDAFENEDLLQRMLEEFDLIVKKRPHL